MSLRDFLSKQFIDVIDWVEPEDGILAYRYPMQDREIQNGGKLTVRDSQMALFVNEGKAANAFAPGVHGRIVFANSDLSGFSIFEEAQYRGVTAADSLMREVEGKDRMLHGPVVLWYRPRRVSTPETQRQPAFA